MSELKDIDSIKNIDEIIDRIKSDHYTCENIIKEKNKIQEIFTEKLKLANTDPEYCKTKFCKFFFDKYVDICEIEVTTSLNFIESDDDILQEYKDVIKYIPMKNIKELFKKSNQLILYKYNQLLNYNREIIFLS